MCLGTLVSYVSIQFHIPVQQLETSCLFYGSAFTECYRLTVEHLYCVLCGCYNPRSFPLNTCKTHVYTCYCKVSKSNITRKLTGYTLLLCWHQVANAAHSLVLAKMFPAQWVTLHNI